MADEVIRVTCPNTDCEYHGEIHEYNENYRQHSIHLCGNCGGELHELATGEAKIAGPFRRVKSNNPLHPKTHPQVKGLTKAERESGWEIQAMVGKVAPPIDG